MRKLFFLLILIGCFTGCVPEDHILEIEIRNTSTEDIHKIRVSTADDRAKFLADVLPPGETITHTLRVSEKYVDGVYTLIFSRSNGTKEKSTGRYMEEEEGYLKKILSFTILEDSVNVQQRKLEVK